MKISLGTAQFGMTYSIHNKPPIPIKEIDLIIKYAEENNILSLDTSPLYGNCEKILGKLNLNNFQITSKVKMFEKKNIYDAYNESIEKSVDNLGIKKLDCYLLHDADNIFKMDYRRIIDLLKKSKDDGLTKKIGLSVYNFENLDETIKYFVPDVIQVPCNIFDRRLIENERLSKYMSLGIQVEVRSIFLQGLLLITDKTILQKFSKWKHVFEKWFNWLDENSINSYDACVSFINNIPGISKVIIGVDSLDQLMMLNDSINKKKPIDFPNELSVNDEYLINPYNWSKL